MTTPTLENGPYVFNVNNLYSEGTNTNFCKRVLLELKNALYALGGAGVIWDVVASSDSASVKNIGDASPDLWSDLTDVVYASSGAHSWVILENQTTGGQLCIDYTANGYFQVHCHYSPGGTFSTDGTTSAKPSDTDSYQFVTNYNFWNDDANERKVVINVMCSADHATTRWYAHYRHATSGEIGGWYGAIERVVNNPTAWNSTIPTAVIRYNSNIETSLTTRNMSPSLDIFDGSTIYCFIETADPYAGWNSAYPTAEGYGDWSSGAAGMINWNNVDQDLLQGYPVMPIGVFKSSGTYGGSLGRLRDIYLGQQSHSTLDTFPFDASRTWVKWGCFVVPWNGTVPQDAV